jgi:protein TonB
MDAVVYPTDFGLPRKGRRMSKQAVAAIGLSAAVHVAVFGYVANETFKEFKLAPIDDRGVIVDSFRPDEPPRPPKDPHTPPKPIAFHVPDSPIPAQPLVDPLPAVIVPQTPSTDPPVVIPQTQQPPVQLASAVPTPQPAKDRLIRNPTWLRKPSASEMERIYPRRALDLEKSGGATLMCTVAASGSVGNCSVIDESPKGLGFGEAALASAKLFKLSPRTVDGEAVEGAKVRIPLVFSLAD